MNVLLYCIGKYVVPYHFIIKVNDEEAFNLSFASIPQEECVCSRYIGSNDISSEVDSISIDVKWAVVGTDPVAFSADIQHNMRQGIGKLLKDFSELRIVFLNDIVIIIAASLVKSVLLSSQRGLTINDDLQKIPMPLPLMSISDFCAGFPMSAKKSVDYKNIKKRFLQYNLRVSLDGSKDILFSNTFVRFLDMTFDKVNDDSLFKYCLRGKPDKLSIKWLIGKAEYSAYFWMDEEQITAVFERFYGAHPETKADFIIRIDAENRKYGLALFRQGLREPVVIPESAYQLIVFKNKFEDYRSENYDRSRGAWIW